MGCSRVWRPSILNYLAFQVWAFLGGVKGLLVAPSEKGAAIQGIMRAAVNIVDNGAIFRMGRGFQKKGTVY